MSELPGLIDVENLEHYRETLSQLAEQVAVEGFYGLREIGLLIVEAINDLSKNTVTPELFAELAGLPDIFTDYCFGVETTIPNIIHTLSHPDLQILLSEDELVMLANRLKREQLGEDLLADENLDEDDFFADLAILASSPSEETAEMVELLVMEAALIERLLLAVDPNAPERLTESLATLSDTLERYENVANSAGFEGLAMICGQVNANVRDFYREPYQFTIEPLQALQTWISNVSDYLAHVNEIGAGLQMLPQLGEPVWSVPISLEAAMAILAKLQASGDDEPIIRKQTATPDDVSLDLPDDVNQELLAILLQELPVQIQGFSEAVLALQAGGSLADLETAQRIAHTVKGAANTVGIKGIAELTHYLEDILMVCAQRQKLPGSGLLNTLIDAADGLEAMCESLTEQMSAPEDALSILQNVLDWANRVDAEGIDDIDMTAIQLTDTAAEDVEQTAIVEQTDKAQAAMVRVAVEQMEDFFRQAGENIILNSQANERLRRIKNHGSIWIPRSFLPKWKATMKAGLSPVSLHYGQTRKSLDITVTYLEKCRDAA